MMRVNVKGIGIAAPGLMGWDAARSVLRGETALIREEQIKLTAGILPANERRRTTSLIKLALQVAQEACVVADCATEQLSSVFASSDGDFYIIDRICEALTLADKPVSPILFHNSVHNAPAGYWAIASGSKMPSTSLAAADATFAAGLLESAVMVNVEKSDVLYVAYDYPAPTPLNEKRRFDVPFSVALLLSKSEGAADYAKLQIDGEFAMTNPQDADSCKNDDLNRLFTENPIAHSLPLLEAIARKQSTAITLSSVENTRLKIKVN